MRLKENSQQEKCITFNILDVKEKCKGNGCFCPMKYLENTIYKRY